MAKAKKVEKPKKSIHPTREEKEMYVLDLLNDHKCLAFTELWQIAEGETDSPFRGGSESTLRRAVRVLAKQGKVNLPRTPKGAILVELPSVTAANMRFDKEAAIAAAPTPKLKDLLRAALNKSPERLKTEAEIDAELAPMRERVAELHGELDKLERKVSDLVCAWADRHLILTTAPLPEVPSLSERGGKILSQ